MKKYLLAFLACTLTLACIAPAWGEESVPPPRKPKEEDSQYKEPEEVYISPNKPNPKRPPYPDIMQRQIEALKKPKQIRKDEALDLTGVKVETRTCTNADLIGGVWKIVYYRLTPTENINRRQRRFQHQYVSFDASHYYARIQSGKSIDDPQRITKLLQSDMREKFVQKYIIKEGEDKTEVIFMVGKEAVARDSCAVVLKPVNAFKPGDVIMKGYLKGGKTVLFQLYRRWF